MLNIISLGAGVQSSTMALMAAHGEILVLNVGGYIGESTRNEIAHAARCGKLIRSLEPIAP